MQVLLVKSIFLEGPSDRNSKEQFNNMTPPVIKFASLDWQDFLLLVLAMALNSNPPLEPWDLNSKVVLYMTQIKVVSCSTHASCLISMFIPRFLIDTPWDLGLGRCKL